MLNHFYSVKLKHRYLIAPSLINTFKFQCQPPALNLKELVYKVQTELSYKILIGLWFYSEADLDLGKDLYIGALPNARCTIIFLFYINRKLFFFPRRKDRVRTNHNKKHKQYSRKALFRTSSLLSSRSFYSKTSSENYLYLSNLFQNLFQSLIKWLSHCRKRELFFWMK